MVLKVNRHPGRRAEGTCAAHAPTLPPWPYRLSCTVKGLVPMVPAQCDSGEEDIAVFQSWGTREHTCAPPPSLPLVFSRPDSPCTSFHPKGTLVARGVLGVGRWSEQPPTWTPPHLTPPLIENLNLKLQLTGRGCTHYHYSPPSPRDSVYLGWGEGHWRNGRGWTGTRQPTWGTHRSPTPGTPVPLLRAQSDHGHVLPPVDP